MDRKKSESKKQFAIFLTVAYGVTCLMGLLTWYGSTVSTEWSVFPTAQILYPALLLNGVLFGMFILSKEFRKKEETAYEKTSVDL